MSGDNYGGLLVDAMLAIDAIAAGAVSADELRRAVADIRRLQRFLAMYLEDLLLEHPLASGGASDGG